MADRKISALSAITTLDGTEEFVVADSGATKKITADNLAAALGGGGDTELAYAEFTSDVDITGSSDATANVVVSAGAVSFDGSTRICIEFFSHRWGGGSGNCLLNLYGGSGGTTDLGRFAFATANVAGPGLLRRFLTPSSGSHTFRIMAWEQGANGFVGAGAGGTATALPGYIRITSVDSV